MILSPSLPNVLFFCQTNVDKQGLLEIFQQMHTEEDFLKFTQRKSIETVQSFVIYFIGVST